MRSKRVKLLLELESIVGRKCYNQFIQNWGPGGRYQGEGRTIRYPLSMEKPDGTIRKLKHQSADSFSDEELMGGYYACGANRIAIMAALEQAIQHLEDRYGFEFPDEA